MLLQKGSDPNIKDNDNQSLLFLAAQNGTLNTLKLLLEKRVTHESNNKMETPLFIAVKNGHIEVVKELLLYPRVASDWNKPSNQNITPLQQAVRNKNLEIVEALLKKGSELNELSIEDLQKAIEIDPDHEMITKLLMKYKNNIFPEIIGQLTIFSNTSSTSDGVEPKISKKQDELHDLNQTPEKNESKEIVPPPAKDS